MYNPAKPQRFSIKLYQVCEAESRYCNTVLGSMFIRDKLVVHNIVKLWISIPNVPRTQKLLLVCLFVVGY